MDHSGDVAGSLILLAREEAGLTQATLAHLAGTSQAAIAAYETGARQPTIPTLYRILRSAGFDPRIRLEPANDHDEFVAAWAASQPAENRREWRQNQDAFLDARR